MKRFQLGFLIAAMAAMCLSIDSVQVCGQEMADEVEEAVDGGDAKPKRAARRARGGANASMASHPVMLALDTDGDGTLSAMEISSALAALATLDTDGDGAITPQEMMPKRGGGAGSKAEGSSSRRANQLLKKDANGDGMLSVDEVPEGFAKKFDKVDTNGDGLIDRAELEAMPSKPKKKNKARDDADEGGDDL